MQVNNSFFKHVFEVSRDTLFVAVGCWVGKEIARIGLNNYGAKISRNSEMAGLSALVNWFALEFLLDSVGVKEGDLRIIATACVSFMATIGLRVAAKTSPLARSALSVSYAAGFAILGLVGVLDLYYKGKSLVG